MTSRLIAGSVRALAPLGRRSFLRNPLLVPGAYVLLLFLLPGSLSVLGVGYVGVPAVLVGLAALALWLFGLTRVSRRRNRQPVEGLLLAYAAGLLVLYGSTYAQAISSAQQASADRGAARYLPVLGVALLIAISVRGMRRLRQLSALIVFAAYFSAAVGLAQRLFGFDYYSLVLKVGFLQRISDGTVEQLDYRVQGSASHPIEYSVACAVALAFSLHLLRFATSRRAARVHMFGAALLAFGTLSASSRSGAIGLALVLLGSISGLDRRQVVNALAGVAIFGAATQAFARGVLSTLRYRIVNSGDDNSVTGRTEDYASAYALIGQHPVLGNGLGSADPALFRYLDNQYLGTMVAQGYVGLVLLLLLFGVPVVLASRVRQLARDPEAANLARACLLAILTLAVTAAFFDEFAFAQTFGLLFVVVGMVGALAGGLARENGITRS